MIRLSKLGLALVVLISFAMMALMAEILYFFWYRRSNFFRRSNGLGIRNQHDTEFTEEPKISATFFSEELLHYLCFKNQCRIEPNEAPRVSTATSSPSPASSPSASQELDDEQLNWCGRPRFLFTINEEETEGVDSENGSTLASLKVKRFGMDDEFSGVATADTSSSTEKTSPEVTIIITEATPFSTPCASPPYLTPSSSPGRDVELGTTGSWDDFILRGSVSQSDAGFHRR